MAFGVLLYPAARPNGNQSKSYAERGIESKGQQIVGTHEREALVHECAEGGETAAEAYGEQQPHVAADAPTVRCAIDESDKEAAYHVDDQRANGKCHRRCFLKPFRNEIAQHGTHGSAKCHEKDIFYHCFFN